MRSPSKPKKNTKKAIVYVILVVLVILVYVWFVSFMGATLHKKNDQPHVFTIPSYFLSLDEYQKSISSIVYHPSILKPTSDERLPIPFFTMRELMTSWDLDDASRDGWNKSPAHPKKGKHIPRFDYSDPSQRKTALKYRDAEMPFIVYNVPQLNKASIGPFGVDQLLENMGDEPRAVEKSSNNRFMYYSVRGMKKPHHKQLLKGSHGRKCVHVNLC